MANCILCSNPCDSVESMGPLGLLHRVQCPRCGEYVVTDDALLALDPPEDFVETHRHLLSAVARRSWDRKERLQINEKLLEDRSEFEARILSQCPQKVGEKLDRILLYLQEHSEYPGSEVQVDIENDYPLFFCHGHEELIFHLHHLKESGLVDLQEFISKGDPWILALTTLGWQHVEALQKLNIESKQAFVAMWFDGQLDAAYTQGIAGIEQDTGFRPLRIDMKQFNEKICDHIIAEIRRSRFLVADVSGHRQGVYFEAGFAIGLGLPVIWTCRKDQIGECHFDTRQYNHVVWETPEELRQKLRDRILATIGSPH